MTDPNVLRNAIAVQQAETVPDLLRLLTHTVPEEDLPTYGELSPGLPDMRIFGNLTSALERVSSDPAARADIGYTAIMFAATLTKVASAQQKRIEELEERLLREERLRRPPKPSSKATAGEAKK